MTNNSWKIIKASDYCASVRDGTHDSPKEQPFGFPLITSKNLGVYSIDYSKTYNVSKEDYDKIQKRSAVDQWDILISMIGTVGLLYIEKNKEIPYACKNVGIFKLAGNEIKAKWLYYYLQSPEGKGFINSHLRGTTQMYVPLDTLREIPVPVPRFDTQCKIVAILCAIDDKIELNNRMNDNLEEQALHIYKKMFNCKETNGILENIIVENAKSKIKVGNARGVNGQYPFFTSGVSILEYTEYLVDGMNCYLNTGGNAGVNFYLGKAAYSTDTWCIKGKDEQTEYLYLLLKNMSNELNDKYFEGSALKHLQKNALKNKDIYIPTKAEFDSFARIVRPIFKTISYNNLENKRLSELRDTLLPKLMSGEIDVSKVEIN